jgi:hypothetical protein
MKNSYSQFKRSVIKDWLSMFFRNISTIPDKKLQIFIS